MEIRTIGITGGIGSGKSYVSRLLSERFGIPIFNCDTEARELMHNSPDLRQSLTRLVGPTLYADGSLNRPLLADFMFRQGHTAEVNAIVHPAARERFEQWRKTFDLHPSLPSDDQQPLAHPVVGIESAILVESRFTDLCDDIWLITAPLELRIERTMKRDNATRKQVEARIGSQTTDDERKRYASHVIVNDEAGNIMQQVESALRQAKVVIG